MMKFLDGRALMYLFFLYVRDDVLGYRCTYDFLGHGKRNELDRLNENRFLSHYK